MTILDTHYYEIFYIWRRHFAFKSKVIGTPNVNGDPQLLQRGPFEDSSVCIHDPAVFSQVPIEKFLA